MNDTDKNVLQWAGLMHDLGKRGKPIFDGKDHVHPFRSAAYVLRVFVRNNFIKDEHHDMAKELSDYILEATTEIDNQKYLK